MASYFGTNGYDFVWANEYSYVHTAGGDDVIYKNKGSGWINGGTGTDRLSFYYSDQRVVVDMENGTATSGTELSLSFHSIEKISGSNFGDTIYGSSGADVISGGGGSDYIHGRAGDDTIYGGAAADSIQGGAGVDQLYGGGGSDVFYFADFETGDLFDDQADTIHGFTDDDAIYIDEDLVFAGAIANPKEGEYSVWQHEGDYVVSWKKFGEYNDIIVKGDDPTGDVFAAEFIL